MYAKPNQDNAALIYGMRPIFEAMESGKTIDKVLFQKGLHGELFKQLFYEVRQHKIPFQYVPLEKLNRLTRNNHQGVVAFLSAIEYSNIFDIVPTIFEEGRVPFLLLLDKVTDVRNVGAIARSAECAGVDAIILPLNGGAQLNEDAVKSSAGALNKIPVCRHSNLVEVIQFLKDSGVEVVGVTEKANHALYNKDLTLWAMSTRASLGTTCATAMIQSLSRWWAPSARSMFLWPRASRFLRLLNKEIP